MAGLINVSGGLFILPDGVEIPNGESAEVKADVLEVPGVAQMIEAGKLEVAKPARKGKDPDPEPSGQ
mgnify:FL=1